MKKEIFLGSTLCPRLWGMPMGVSGCVSFAAVTQELHELPELISHIEVKAVAV